MKNKSKLVGFPIEFLYFLHQIYFALGKHMEKKFAECCKLTFSQFWIVHCVVECKNEKENSQSFIAKVMHLSEATVSKHIEKLVKLDVLKKRIDKKNRRQFILEITKKGDKEYQKSVTTLSYELDKIFGKVEKTHESIVTNNFKIILENIK